MSREIIKAELTELVSGASRRGILVVFSHDCPEGYYRTGEHGKTLISEAELEQLRKQYDKVVTFSLKKSRQ